MTDDQAHPTPTHKFTDARHFVRSVMDEGGQIRTAQKRFRPPPKWPPVEAAKLWEQRGAEAIRALKTDFDFLRSLQEEILSVDQAAHFLRTTPQKIREMLNIGELGGLKIGATWYASAENVLYKCANPGTIIDRDVRNAVLRSYQRSSRGYSISITATTAP